MKNITITTGNPIVDAVGKMSFTGNVTPEAWYYSITDEKGKPQFIAMSLLAEIVYWYRPSEKRDELTNSVHFVKKFSKDLLQLDYYRLSKKFNVSKEIIKSNLVLLEKLGVIRREFRTIKLSNRKLPNVLYIELFPQRLSELTYLEGEEFNGKDCEINQDAYGNLHGYLGENSNTNTKTIPEITTDNTTTNRDDVCLRLKSIGLTDEEIKTICRLRAFNPDRCNKAIDLFLSQKTPIDNVVGWLIAAITNSYTTTVRSRPKSSVQWGKDMLSTEKIDFKELEEALLDN